MSERTRPAPGSDRTPESQPRSLAVQKKLPPFSRCLMSERLIVESGTLGGANIFIRVEANFPLPLTGRIHQHVGILNVNIKPLLLEVLLFCLQVVLPGTLPGRRRRLPLSCGRGLLLPSARRSVTPSQVTRISYQFFFLPSSFWHTAKPASHRWRFLPQAPRVKPALRTRLQPSDY